MLTLSQYEKIAYKLIHSWHKKKGRLAITDELVGRVIRFMAVADWKYDPAKSRLTRKKYRSMKGIYAIREYVKPAKAVFLPLDDNISNSSYKENEVAARKVDFLINNAGLSRLEHSVIDGVLQEQSIGMIAESLGITDYKCYRVKDSAFSKIKRINNVE